MIGNSPFMLVYGREARLPLSLDFPSLELAHQLELEKNDAMTITLVELLELEETKNKSMQVIEAHQA